MTSILIAVGVYTSMVALGVVALRTRRRFGWWHHVGYAASCATALAAVWLAPHLLMALPIGALVMLPFTRGGSRSHLMAGGGGLVGWGAVMVARIMQ